MIVKEMTTAYLMTDDKNNIWTNKVFLFENDKLAEDFFSSPMLVLATLCVELEEDEDLESIQYKHLRTSKVKTFYGVTFNCKHRGEVKIKMVNKGFLVEKVKSYE